MSDLPTILGALSEARVDFVLIGGMAGVVHGSSRVTVDVDCVYSRAAANIVRLASALAPLHPTLRGAPPGLPFRFDAATISAGLNFTLATSLGPVDLLGEATGGGTWEALQTESVTVSVFGRPCRVVTLETLIRLKRAAGRAKDLEAVAELEALRDAQRED